MPGKTHYIILLFQLFLFSGTAVRAQTVVPDRPVPDQIVPDTAVVQHQYEESNRFFDMLQDRSADSRFARRLYRALVSKDSRSDVTEPVDAVLEKEVNYYKEFEGRPINSVRIYRNNIFSDGYPKSDYRSIANSLHRVTNENKILRNLLFSPGDRVSATLFAQNEQLLRALDYLSDVSILLQESAEGEGVDVHIITRDSWSIGITIHSAPLSRRYIDIYDSNIMGTGNRLDLRTYVNYKGDKYGGNMLDYHASNLWGSFFALEAKVGKGYEEHHYGVKLDKEFIRASDFIAGGVVEDKKHYDWQMTRDTMLLARRRNYDLWAGKSWAFPQVKGSYYLSARFQDMTFHERPEVRPDSNARYHSYRALLFNTGIYRETYYRGNMIYGYGRPENIPYGHKFEITAGKYWGEFGDKLYTAFTSAVGWQARNIYLRAGATVSSYWDDHGKPIQSALEVELDGFSNLYRARRNYIRHFLSMRYLNGFNRLKGEGERITFWDDANLVGLRRDENNWGMVRLVANTETVMFTPIYFYGFRFVFYGYADFGWIGDYSNPFRNDFYTAFGVGVRLKNERLIFGTIQLRFGLALKNTGMADYLHVRYSGQRHFEIPPFKANQPELFEFR